MPYTGGNKTINLFINRLEFRRARNIFNND